MENVRECNIKTFLHIGSTIINIAVHLTYCNLGFFLARLKLSLIMSLDHTGDPITFVD